MMRMGRAFTSFAHKRDQSESSCVRQTIVFFCLVDISLSPSPMNTKHYTVCHVMSCQVIEKKVAHLVTH